MQVTGMRIVSRRGENMRPSSGDAYFSDGQSFRWFEHALTGEILFRSYRMVGTQAEPFTFKSPKRAAAVQVALDS